MAPLFRSDGQARILAELVFATDDDMSITELTRRAGVAYGSAHREVERLVQAGLLRQRRVGGARMVQLDPDSPLTAPVRALLLVSAGPVPLLKAELSTLDGIERAFIFGSFAARMHGLAGDPPNDIDLMIWGTPDPMSVYEACRRVGDQVGRPVNATLMTRDEVRRGGAFLDHIRANPVVPVIDGGIGWP